MQQKLKELELDDKTPHNQNMLLGEMAVSQRLWA